MHPDDQLDELLLEWDDRRRRGEEVTAAELTHDCPELTELLEQRIARLKAMDWLDAADSRSPSDRTDPESIATAEKSIPLPSTDMTSDELLQHLSDTDLLSDEEIRLWRDQCLHGTAGDDARKLASRLIEEGRITAYQASILLQGQTEKLLIDKYLILDSIDAGGMGVVFKAVHRPMNRVVALKMLSPHLLNSPEKVQRFRREVQVAASLTHHNIVTAYDADESKGVHFLVMEHVQGRNLREIVRDRGPLTVSKAVDCILQAAHGLAHAHRIGVIHRDIKPGNVMLTDDGILKVLDLGLARVDEGLQLVEQEFTTDFVTAEMQDDAAGEQLTSAGVLMGTVAFMAPEQAVDTHNVDHRADIYSLGCTLYYLLVGEPPYGGENPLQTLLAHREQPIPSLRQFRPDVPEGLDRIFQKMLARQPDDRQRSMTEVIGELEALDVASSHRGALDAPAKKRGGTRDDTVPAPAPVTSRDEHSAAAIPALSKERSTWHAKTTVPALVTVAIVGLLWAILPDAGKRNDGGDISETPAELLQAPVAAPTIEQPPPTDPDPSLAAGPGLLVSSTGPEEVRIFPIEGAAYDLKFTPDGESVLIARGGSQKTIDMWRLSDGKLIRQFEGHTKAPFVIDVAPDGNWLLSGGFDQTVRLWDIETGQQENLLHAPVTSAQGETAGRICGVAFAPDGRRAVACGNDDVIRIWEIPSGSPLGQLDVQQVTGKSTDAVYDAFFRPRKKQVVATWGTALRIWSPADNSVTTRVPYPKYGAHRLAASRDGRYVVAGNSNSP